MFDKSKITDVHKYGFNDGMTIVLEDKLIKIIEFEGVYCTNVMFDAIKINVYKNATKKAKVKIVNKALKAFNPELFEKGQYYIDVSLLSL